MTEQVKQNIPVVFFPAAADACALYRLFIPHLSTPNSRYIFEYGPLDVRTFQGCKVAVVQRQVSDQNQIAMKRLKEEGLKVVYDIDDDIWSLPAYNPGKKIFTDHQAGFLKCATEADILTVSTMGLATAARTGFKLNKEIVIIPNAIDLNLFKYKNIVRNDDRVLIGWGGSNTHSDDVREAFQGVVEVLDENPHAYMELVGASAENTTSQILIEKGKRILRKTTSASPITRHAKTRFRQWVPVGEYPNRLTGWGWDIALAPLEENRFNRSKSNIKMLEAAAMKIPCLASDVRPYFEFCSLGGDDLKWLLCRSQRDWKNKLNTLVNEPERRTHLGQLMYDVTNNFFNIEKIKHNWYHCFSQGIV